MRIETITTTGEGKEVRRMGKLKPICFVIIAKAKTLPINQIFQGDKNENPMEAVFKTIEIIKKFYPNAKINVRVEV